jgi:phosphoserine phosphatase
MLEAGNREAFIDKMAKKLFLSDFDGTLVKKDILDVVCGIVDKEEESYNLNFEFIQGKRDGLPTLKRRIDFLKGVSLNHIFDILRKNSYLMKGVKELFDYLRNNGYTTVLHSGNIIPVLQYYKDYLGIDYIIGTLPRIKDDLIQGIELEDFNGKEFKVLGCQEIIDTFCFKKQDIIAIGDSPSDLGVFGLAGKTIAINPKGGIEKKATFVIGEDLTQVIDILKGL